MFLKIHTLSGFFFFFKLSYKIFLTGGLFLFYKVFLFLIKIIFPFKISVDVLIFSLDFTRLIK